MAPAPVHSQEKEQEDDNRSNHARAPALVRVRILTVVHTGTAPIVAVVGAPAVVGATMVAASTAPYPPMMSHVATTAARICQEGALGLVLRTTSWTTLCT